MITVYGIMYHALEYAEQTIKALYDTASEDFELHIIDSHSSRSSETIYPAMARLVDNRTIDSFYAFDANVRGWGFNEAFTQTPPNSTENFCIFTDLDVIPDFDWIKESRRMQEMSNITGFSLKTDNYVPPNCGFDANDPGFGTWLMGIKTKLFEDRIVRNNVPFVDFICRAVIGNEQKSTMKLYHLGWDIWKDYPEYWDHKVAGIDWQAPPDKMTYSLVLPTLQ